MALLAVRTMAEALLTLSGDEFELSENHIFEPEYHQARYVEAVTSTAALPGAFQIGKAPGLVANPSRGTQPSYADDEADATTLEWVGMINADGSAVTDAAGTKNVCALKSNCIRRGYIDYSLARSVTRDFHEKKKKAAIQKNDILINSTGDGTIGRVAVYNETFPALVDGHITIVRLKDPDLAWYIGAFLLSDIGQRQMYRYINGSSGQVEIYPQDISRIWVKPPKSGEHKKAVADAFRAAAALHSEFYRKLQAALVSV